MQVAAMKILNASRKFIEGAMGRMGRNHIWRFPLLKKEQKESSDINYYENRL